LLLWAVTVAAVIIFTVTIPCGRSRASTQSEFGSITAIGGSLTISRGQHSFAAAYGSPISSGDTLATGADGHATLTLAGGSQIELTASTTLTITGKSPNSKGGAVSVILLGGLIHSIVVAGAATPPRFEVHTPNTVASAWGTAFQTAYANGASRKAFKGCTEFTDVAVYDGVVRVANAANPAAPPITVHTGERATVPCAQAALLASGPATAMGVSIWNPVAGATASGLSGIAGVVAAGSAGGGGGASNKPLVTAKSPVQ
jgi:ferric-dicitrate binding protein FerR (iron transport regulator)